MEIIFDDISKNGYSSLLKTKLFRNKGYDLIVASYNVTSAILSRDSNYIVDVAR